ncbi:MAG: hypothetical protein NUV80_04320 [Candidatus Berkelbacteria bacterium]|nr:hypothetical protein [Candidatus Berkelbacteria bacterium]MCR4307765.1 hypothetical protein [Candidatus Berkelbacteria bacterium]
MTNEFADSGWIESPENVANLAGGRRRQVSWADRLQIVAFLFLVALDSVIYVFSDEEDSDAWVAPSTKKVIRTTLGLILLITIFTLYVWAALTGAVRS